MSLVSSKLFALNLVEVDPEIHAGKRMPYDDRDARLASLESEMEMFRQWKKSVTPMDTGVLGSPAALGSPPVPRSPSESASSGDSLFDDLPTIDSEPTNAYPSSTEIRAIKAPEVKHKDAMAKITYDIMTIVEGYGQNERNSQNNLWLGRVNFEPIVRTHVEKGHIIPLVLPAFPWKSVNKVEKVIGAVPDLGEEFALGRLNNICEDIKAIYSPGAYVLITSDGLVYNDLLGIPDPETYEYGSTLRRMARELGYENIRFTRIMNLLGLIDDDKEFLTDVSEEEYMRTVENTRKLLVNRYLRPDYNFQQDLADDEDIKLTYCGYMLFLSKDLRHSPITKDSTGKNDYKRIVKRVATDMIIRGKAFAALIEDILPDHVRLSIHRSTGLKKLSFPLVPQPNHFSMTPWHCSVAVTTQGEFRTTHAQAVRGHYNLIEQDGRPYYFRQKSEIFDDWAGKADIQFFYPRGVRVIAKPVKEGEQLPKLEAKDNARLVELGKGFSPVICTGFAA